MFSDIGNFLSYGTGALGLIGIVYFIIQKFFSGDDNKLEELRNKQRKQKEEKVKKLENKKQETKENYDNLKKDVKEKEDEINNNLEKAGNVENESKSNKKLNDTINDLNETW
jgi:septal ring factor EnvC (AmiA/AmiB activator)